MYGNGGRFPSSPKDRLIAVDDVDFKLKYEIVVCVYDESNGCVLDWSLTVEAVKGLELEELVGKYHVGLHLMAQKMVEEIQSFITGIIHCSVFLPARLFLKYR